MNRFGQWKVFQVKKTQKEDTFAPDFALRTVQFICE